jgi:FixJ family two-component response regulator
MGGSELLGRIEQARLPVRVIVITGYATLEAAVDCLRKGAVDFLVKPFDMEAFKASVSKALARSALGGPRGEPDWGAVALHYGLTKRQAEVLRAFYTTGKSNRELSKELCLSHHTVKSHLKAAFAKLAVASRAQLLRKLQDAS